METAGIGYIYSKIKQQQPPINRFMLVEGRVTIYKRRLVFVEHLETR